MPMTQAEFDAIADEFGVENPSEVSKKYGLSWKEQIDLMRVHNQKIFDDWATEYAKRIGRPVNEVRAEVIQQRQLTAEHCNEVYRKEVGITTSKEDTMAKKNAANAQTVTENTINESKEDTTMTENTTANNTELANIEGVAFKTYKNGNWGHNRPVDIERHTIIRDTVKLGRVKGIEPVTCIPNETIYNITEDEGEIAILGKACKKFGWENGVCTPYKASLNHGRPNPEYKGHGWLVWFEQKFYKTGERAGQPKERGCTIAYPMEAFIWDTESGLPEFDVEKKAAADLRKAKAALKKAEDEYKAKGGKRTKKRRTTKKDTKKATAKKVEPTLDINELMQAAIDRLVAEKLEEAIAKALAS